MPQNKYEILFLHSDSDLLFWTSEKAAAAAVANNMCSVDAWFALLFQRLKITKNWKIAYFLILV